MRINFRQGIVSHQPPTKSEAGYGSFLPGFMQKVGNNYNLIANQKPVTLTIAHKSTNYTYVEDSSIADAWIGPFNIQQNYWLYWDFNPLTFERTFGKTTVEPIAQSVEPGYSDTVILQSISGVPGVGRFIVQGYYAPRYGRELAVSGTGTNDGTYTITSTSFDNATGNTSIYVSVNITVDTGNGGIAAFDIDSYGIPLKTEDRHWYDTSTNTHKVWKGSYWSEVIRVFAVHITTGGTSIFPLTITHGTTIGTQIGNTSAVHSGRVIYDEDTNVIRRDNGTFFTTEDQFFSGSSRVDAIRLESNVVRAQFPTENAIAAFTPVAWYSDGKCRIANYNDIGSAVIGMLMEDVMKDDVGGVVIQGAVTNLEWNWSSSNPRFNYVGVGDPLWIDNGELVPYDPHTTDVVQYRTGRVPVARVLSSDTVIFEQGLGGKGERGPAGSFDNMPEASYDLLGGVFLSVQPEPGEDPVAVGINDPILQQIPTHFHSATETLFASAGNLESVNVQTALEELDTEKLNVSGGTMAGMLTLASDPSQSLHAASKQYVDGLVSGLLWTDPICVVNLIAIDVATPPSQPEYSDAYIVPEFPAGAWSIGNAMGIQTGDLVVWNGSTWENRGPLENTKTYRFGVSLTSITPPAGILYTQENKIITVQGSDVTNFQVETPVNNTAVFVCNESSMYAYQQFAFKDTTEETKWINIGGIMAALSVDDVTIKTEGNIISTIDYADGGLVDARSLQGQTLTNLDSRYALAAHTHDSLYYTKQYIDSNMLTKDNLNQLFETNNTIANITLDVTNENIFAHTITQDVTFTIGGTSPQCHGITVILTLDSSGTVHNVNWPGNIKWASKLPPELSITPGSTDIISLLTTDGGTSWYGFLSGNDFGFVV